MKFAILIMGALVLFLFAGVIPVPGGFNANSIYYSPVMMLLFLLLSILSIRCCIHRRFRLKQAGFHLVHSGAVLILAGAFIGYIAGTKGTVQLSLLPQKPAGHFMTAKGDTADFGFDVAAEDFQVKFYPPKYQLFRPVAPDKVVPGQMPYEKAGEFSAGENGVCVIAGAGSVSNLWSEARQEWVQRKMFPDGSFLYRAEQTPSFFGVTLLINGRKLPVTINHPASYQGWRFYLMSYDQKNQSYVQLSARRDPGRHAVVAGIWILIAGTFIFCFRREGGAL